MKGLWIAVYYMNDAAGMFVYKFKTRKEARAKLKEWRNNKFMSDKGTWKIYREWVMNLPTSHNSTENFVWVHKH